MLLSEQQRLVQLSAIGRGFARGARLVAWVLATLLASVPVAAQPPKPTTLRLGGVIPGGVGVAATEGWSSYDFDVANYSDTDRLARVIMFYSALPDVQYGRDVWVPARSTIKSWLLAGPAAAKSEIEMLLYDRTDGTERLILPAGEERIRSRIV